MTETDNKKTGMSRYEYRKLNHRCISCNTQDAYTLNGRARCAVCAEKHRESAHWHGIEHREQITKAKKARYDALAEAGLCPRCGKRPLTKEGGWCEQCLATKRKRDRELRRERGAISNEQAAAMGLCYRCREEPAMEGYSYCKECHEWWESVRNKGKKNEYFTFMG